MPVGWYFFFSINFILIKPATLHVYYIIYRFPLRLGVLDTPLCGKICQWLATGQWLPPCTPLSSTKKTDRHDITYVLLKVVLNTKTLITQLEVFQYLTI